MKKQRPTQPRASRKKLALKREIIGTLVRARGRGEDYLTLTPIPWPPPPCNNPIYSA